MSLNPQSHFERFLRPILASRFFTVSALIHLLIIFLFGGKVLFNKYVEPPDFQAAGDPNGTDVNIPPPQEPPPQPPPPTLVAPPPTSHATLNAITTLAATSMPSFSMPLPAIAPPTFNRPVRTGVPTFDPTRHVVLPASMRARENGARQQQAASVGAKSEAEPSVVRALQWLQAQQQSDGSWGSPGVHDAFTGLSLLCFLGHGETPQGSHEFGVVTTNAIQALVTQANKHQGRFGGYDSFPGVAPVYEHGIATYALCEAYTMTKDETLVPVIKEAIGYIVNGQRADGGWTYGYDTTPDDPAAKDALQHFKSDTSVSGWQIQALKAAHLTGIPGMDQIVHPALDKAMHNLDRVFNPRDGSFGYRKAGDRPYNLTGVGVLSKLFWLGRPDRTVRQALKTIESVDLDYNSKQCDLYAWYYDTQACYQAQESAWGWWKDRFQNQLIGKQAPDGSWPPTGGEEHGGGKGSANYATATSGDGPLYRTTLSCLMLEVFYRYLPTSRETSLGGGVEGL
jgi:hypothetical protein